ncbi:uncharacterized protein LOC128173113 isoform X1 [Crassostrea angulata]|uniref:uncharacterized protein LOC128173113 isoform X1 n=2 Tax=Magallana angulata TaxID=2784310 RepID=UPI0022B0FC49|nr:uncharacterized protein LOC128173113 isoform X1 [Crassostrea angulata]
MQCITEFKNSRKTMPKRALEGRSTKRRRPAKVPRNDDLSLQAEPVSDEPVSRAEPVSSDAINYDLLAAAILRQSQTLSQNQTNSSDTTMDILQPCVQNQGDMEAHAHPMASQQTTTSTVSDNQPQQNIADLVSALLQQDGQGEPATANLKNVIDLSDGIPLGAATPHRLKAKIWANQFIDLGLLLQRREDPISLNISSGSLIVQQGSSKPKLPMSIQRWTDAFLIFMGIFIEKYPEQAPHLLKYCYFIREMNKMLGDKAWRIYDENFRMLKETVELPWQKPVEELRIKAASSNYQFQQPFRANTGNKPIRFCYAFNNGEQCTHNPCSFAHRCQSCSGSHARANCRFRKQKPTNTNTVTKSSTITQPTTFPSQPKKFR